jgi:hypothetical protein
MTKSGFSLNVDFSLWLKLKLLILAPSSVLDKQGTKLDFSLHADFSINLD